MQERVRQEEIATAKGVGTEPALPKVQQWDALMNAIRHPGLAFTRREVDAFQRFVERVLPPNGYVIRKWFERREKKMHYHDAPKEILEYTRGDPEHAKDVVIYVPGQFDTENYDRMNALYEREHPDPEKTLHDEGWITLNWPYSGRDLRRMYTLEEHLLKLVKKHIMRGARVRIVAYSFGGVAAKAAADELDSEYGDKFTLTLHHTPRDPTAGFFLRWANVQAVHRGFGYEPDTPHRYYLDVIEGDLDAIVPPGRHFPGRDGRRVSSRVLRGSTHQNPFPNTEVIDEMRKRLNKAKTKLIKNEEERKRLAK